MNKAQKIFFLRRRVLVKITEGLMNRTYAIVERLAVNEEKVMELYAAFGDKFPEHRQFWADISEEEKRHAGLLRDFGNLVDERDIKLNLTRINEESVNRSIRFLEGEILKAKNNGMDCKQAFVLARGLEQGIVESECFKIFNTDVKDLIKLFNALNSDTQRHYEIMCKKCEIYCKEG
jgi:hypothetical protein